MRALLTCTRIITQFPLCAGAFSSILAIVLVLGGQASTSHAVDPEYAMMPELEIVDFLATELGYHDMYLVSGVVQNAQFPEQLTVTIYVSGQVVGTCQPDTQGYFEINIHCIGGAVMSETVESPFVATASLTI